jgi:hypothetical protein
VILVDWNENRRLVILNDDGTLDRVIPCSMSYPFDVTYLDDRTVAVSASIKCIMQGKFNIID